ncbi:hypothetical protein [Thalassotalea sp. PLHSN55]|uniref:hypothetical protein n=1 Tax=Thalassotalea sp. PLHSN55 TaxID=3435888 RepID=UPI003F825DF0
MVKELRNELSLHVIGNGPVADETPNIGFKIRFNRFASKCALNKDELWINNSRVKPHQSGYKSEGEQASQVLDTALLKQAQTLKQSIACWPSTGMVVISYFSLIKKKIKVYQMPLLPSIVRTPDMPPRKPLACAFHNWLGERRVVFTQKVNIEPWPSLFVKIEEGYGKSVIKPFEELSKLAKLSKADGWGLLRKLSEIPAKHWLEFSSFEQISLVEHLFYLDRTSHETLNWWLYDYDASIQVDIIYKRLAWCQQQLFLNQVESET